MEGQELVDAIITRAKETRPSVRQPKQSLKIRDTFGGPMTAKLVALTLINAYHSKYDLVAILQAAIEVLVDENAELPDANSGERVVDTKGKMK